MGMEVALRDDRIGGPVLGGRRRRGIVSRIRGDAAVPTIFVAGEDDQMGGLHDSGLYYEQSRAPRVRVIAGNGATHCHAIVPMSQCENGSRGVQRLDAVMAHAAATLYLRPDAPEWRLRKSLARDIVWGDGLRDIERERGPFLPLATTWSAAVERAGIDARVRSNRRRRASRAEVGDREGARSIDERVR